MKKLVAESLNEYTTKENEFADEQIELYNKSKKFVEKHPSYTDNNIYKVINSIQNKGYYVVTISGRWTDTDVDNLLYLLDSANIKYKEINDDEDLRFRGHYDKGIKIFNEEKNPKITNKIIKILQKADPAGDAIYHLINKNI